MLFLRYSGRAPSTNLNSSAERLHCFLLHPVRKISVQVSCMITLGHSSLRRRFAIVLRGSYTIRDMLLHMKQGMKQTLSIVRDGPAD